MYSNLLGLSFFPQKELKPIDKCFLVYVLGEFESCSILRKLCDLFMFEKSGANAKKTKVGCKHEKW